MPQNPSLRGFRDCHSKTLSKRAWKSVFDADNRLPQLDQESVEDVVDAMQWKSCNLEQAFDQFAHANFRQHILKRWWPGGGSYSPTQLNSRWAEVRILQMLGLDENCGDYCREESLGHDLLKVYLLNFQYHHHSIATTAMQKGTKPLRAEHAIRFLSRIAKQQLPDPYNNWLYFELQLLAQLCSQYRCETRIHFDPYWDRYVRQRFLDFFASPAQDQRINWEEWWATAELVVQCIFDRDDRHFATIINSLVEKCERAIERNSLSSYDNRRPGNRLEPSMHELRSNYQRLAWLKPAQQLLSEENRDHGLFCSLVLKKPGYYGSQSWHFMRDIEFAVSDWELMPDPDATKSEQSKLIECATVTATITLRGTLPAEPEKRTELLKTLTGALTCQIDGSGSASATSPIWHTTVPDPKMSDRKLDILQITWLIRHTDARNPARWRFGGIAFEVQRFPNPTPAPSETKEAVPS